MARTQYARSMDQVIPLIQAAEDAAHEGHWTALVITFEAAPAFDPEFSVLRSNRPWLAASVALEAPVAPATPLLTSLPTFVPAITKAEYRARFEEIKKHIAQGDTYQVNFTFPMMATITSQIASDLFAFLSQPEVPPFARFLQLEDTTVLCFSPELFFNYAEGAGEKHITCRPMKGTREHGPGAEDDLRNSEKDRAENLMVVDMVRNDLGRIAIPGSIEVPSLFAIETYPTVLQMTSTVKCRSTASLVEIFKALFPCASIVGAPKIETLKLIQALEAAPRGVYTGAIGIVGPDFAEFCVAIRTMEIAENVATYSVGSGIVWDSDLEQEWQECLAKARILNPFGKGLKLVETMFSDGDIFLLERHLVRLQGSCEAFGIPYDEETVRATLAAHAAQKMRIRLTVDETGLIEATCKEATAPLAISPGAASITLSAKFASKPVQSNNPWLRHKSTYRPYFQPPFEGEDVLSFNEKGYLTEFSIGNLVIEANEGFLTPPVEDGLLPGVFRQELLDGGVVREAQLTRTDLLNAKAAYRVNSVRGWERVEF